MTTQRLCKECRTETNNTEHEHEPKVMATCERCFQTRRCVNVPVKQ